MVHDQPPAEAGLLSVWSPRASIKRTPDVVERRTSCGQSADRAGEVAGREQLGLKHPAALSLMGTGLSFTCDLSGPGWG